MTSIRAQIAAQLKTDFAKAGVTIDVHPFGYLPEELRRPAVAIFRETVGQDVASLDHGFILQIFAVQGVATESTEDALDALLDEVLLSLRRLGVVTFKEAKRQVLADVFQGWEITASWASADYYKSTVTTES
jgi:hypothetical protein